LKLSLDPHVFNAVSLFVMFDLNGPILWAAEPLPTGLQLSKAPAIGVSNGGNDMHVAAFTAALSRLSYWSAGIRLGTRAKTNNNPSVLVRR
jgi:hypothetical protein